jgi:hypothetical protein
MDWQSLYDWFMGLGAPYGVNPIIFGSIYVGAVPFFWLAIAWLVRNVRRSKPTTGPILMAGCCNVSSYVYLLVVVENVAWWVYGLIIGIIGYALLAMWKLAKRKMHDAARPRLREGLE